MSAQLAIKRTLLGALAGAVIGLIILLHKQRKLMKTGLFTDYKFLQFHPHVLSLLRKAAPGFKQTQFSVTDEFKALVADFDQVVKAFLDFRTGVPVSATHVLDHLAHIRSALAQHRDVSELLKVQQDMVQHVTAWGK